MADVVVIVPPTIADGFRLAGARVWPAADAATARELILRGLDDPDAGILAVADEHLSALDARTRRSVERRARPLVVSLPTPVTVGPEVRRRAYFVELIRRAIGYRVVLGAGEPRS